jgi:hypothetical protein
MSESAQNCGWLCFGLRDDDQSAPRRDPRRSCGRLLALMGADEEGTHERLRARFRELVDPKIKEHRGRIVKNADSDEVAR